MNRPTPCSAASAMIGPAEALLRRTVVIGADDSVVEVGDVYDVDAKVLEFLLQGKSDRFSGQFRFS